MGARAGSDLLLMRDASGLRLKTRDALIEAVLGSLARDDGRDLTEEFLAERRAEARAKGWWHVSPSSNAFPRPQNSSSHR